MSAEDDALSRLDEIADDVCWLRQDATAFKAQLESSSRAQAIELDRMRGELLGQWKEMASRSAFNAVSTALDQLRAMHAGLNPTDDERTVAQLGAVMCSLRIALRGLGYEEFSVESGAAFDAQRMEIVGYEVGTPGAVIRTARPGYRTRETIAGVCGVILGEAATT